MYFTGEVPDVPRAWLDDSNGAIVETASGIEYSFWQGRFRFAVSIVDDEVVEPLRALPDPNARS